MQNTVIRTALRSLLRSTSREKAAIQTIEVARKYAEVYQSVDEQTGQKTFRVPKMRGVDDDMREWSIFMLLEHNTIVNRSITAVTCQLARGEKLHGDALIDPKHDVMPTASAGIDQVEAFERSIRDHIESVEQLGNLRETATLAHPVFGNFDAHMWNCMFPFHLKLHYPQALKIIEGIK